MPTPLKHYELDHIVRRSDALILLKASRIHAYLCGMGITPPDDALIEFEHDVSPLEIDVRSWYPVVVREETFDKQQLDHPWVRIA